VRPPTARSLTLDLLSSLRGHSLPVAAIVAAANLFEVQENSVRVAVARLLASGRIERDARGRYRLGAQADPVDRQVRGWRHLEEHLRPWDGAWTGVHLGELPLPRRRAGKRRSRALRFKGFALLSPGLAVRPDNLQMPLEVLRTELHELGLEAGAVVFGIRDLDPASDARSRGLWNTAELCDGYRRSIQDLERSRLQLGQIEPEAAMVESFLLGGRVIRQLVLDPLLPEPILPASERSALVAALRDYDACGRQVWSSFMARHGAAHIGNSGAPADTRAGMAWRLH